MFIICRSPKGGVGTSVVAAALALRHAHAGHPTVLVDLAGDQPDLLGVAPSSSLGIGDWAAGGDDVPVEALTALEVEVGGGLSLLPRGSVSSSDRLGVAAAVLGTGHRSVVIDAGVTARPVWAPPDAVDVVVLRACYLGVRRAGRLAAGTRLPPQRLEVEVVPSGGRVTVVVRFDAPTNVPIVGALVGDLALDAEATMRLER